MNLKELRALPKGAILILILMSGTFIVGASLVWVGLSVPADGTVDNTPIETTYFSSSVNPFHFGHVGLANASNPVPFTVTNESGTARTLHIYDSTTTDTTLELVIEYSNGQPYSPITLTPGQSVNLQAYIVTTEDSVPGGFNMTVRMD